MSESNDSFWKNSPEAESIIAEIPLKITTELNDNSLPIINASIEKLGYRITPPKKSSDANREKHFIIVPTQERLNKYLENKKKSLIKPMIPGAILTILMLVGVMLPLSLKWDEPFGTIWTVIFAVLSIIALFYTLGHNIIFNEKFARFSDITVYTDCVEIRRFIGPGTNGQVYASNREDLKAKLGRADDGLKMNYCPATENQMGFLNCLYVIDNVLEHTSYSYGIYMDLELYCILYAYLKSK